MVPFRRFRRQHNVAKGSCPAISGSSEFVQDIIEWYGSESRILVCLNLHHRLPTGFKSHPWVWHLLAHHLCGGVMTGRFWCGTNQGPVTEPIQKDSARRVRHCIKPLHQGKHHPPPPDPDKAPLSHNHRGHVTSGKLLTTNCPSYTVHPTFGF
jgi:hypothetical protein